MAIEKIQAIRGMSDMLPEDAPLWHFFEKEASSLAKLYGYQHIRTPIVEQTRLFKRGIGEVTDIVEKEMYSFVDSLNGDELSLRPENTASVVRACIEHNLLYEGPKRLWYMGPMFRHERPSVRYGSNGLQRPGYGRRTAFNAEPPLEASRNRSRSS